MNEKSDDDIVIIAALRTPLSKSRNGELANVPPSELLRTVLQATLQHVSPQVLAQDVEDVCVGNVLMPPVSFATLRMAAIAAGLPVSTSLYTVNRQCASGLQAIANIANRIHAQEITIGIGAGVESMSQFPMHKMRLPEKAVDWNQMKHIPNAMDCLLPMGVTGDTVAVEYGLERHVLDEFALRSHQKAASAQQQGKFDAEIVAVGSLRKDNSIRPETTASALSRLPPSFTPSGVSTAGNSSPTTDGAAAVILTTRREAVRRGLRICAVWRGYAVSGVPPSVMGIGPAVAIPVVLKHTGLSTEDIDVFEINEAFASQAYWCIQTLRLDPNKVNPLGGAIALGHPLGATGARMIATLVHELHRRPGARYGVVSMCVGTGMGAAAVIEVEPTSSL